MHFLIPKSKQYRPDVDSLRALAVFLVIIFHFFPRVIPGGFIGVDVFFVISGYLIIRNIHSGIQKEQFSLFNFYTRRIKRLYPTYITVILACAVTSWFLLAPETMLRFGKSLVASAVYFSNVTFWREAGYFDVDSELKPLLHTWSLSVEEQFYLVFPSLILLFSKFKMRIEWLLGIIFVVSLGAALSTMHLSQPTVFFLSPFRMWEFSIGGFLAIGLFPNKLSPRIKQLLLWLGLSLICFSAAAYDPAISFPGWWVLMPAIGTYLAIGAGNNLQCRLVSVLKWKPIVVCGLLSYALYLWHWPLLIFYKHYAEKVHITYVEGAILLTTTFVLSWISTFIIEPPIRFGRYRARFVLIPVLLCSSLFVGFGTYLQKTNGASQRFELSGLYDSTKRQQGAYVSESKLAKRSCSDFIETGAFSARELKKICQVYGDGDTLDFVLWGDSHAFSLTYALKADTDATFLAFGLSGCPPLLGVNRADGKANYKKCNAKLQDKVFKQIKALAPPVVVLIGRWSVYRHGWIQNGTIKQTTCFLCDKDCDQTASADSSYQVLERRIPDSIKQIASVSPLLVLHSVPSLKKRGDELITQPSKQHAQYVPSRAEHTKYNEDVRQLFDKLKETIPINDFDPAESLCASGQCKLYDKNILYYFDDNHLTIPAWRTLTPEIIKKIKAISKR